VFSSRVRASGWRYCCDVCPQGLDIPKLVSMYHEASFGRAFTLNFALGAMRDDELPSACLACGDCKALCPQDIDIPDILEKFADVIADMRRMRPPLPPTKPAASAD
jgi:predicted aldo/keto reductase-like oxidoreductase